MGLVLFNFTVNDPAEKKVSDKTVYVSSEQIIQWPEVYMGNGFDTGKTAKVNKKKYNKNTHKSTFGRSWRKCDKGLTRIVSIIG